MSISPNPSSLAPIGTAGRATLWEISWDLYCQIRSATEGQGLRLTYLDGTLDIDEMAPSQLHEEAKTILARLLEAWAVEMDVDLRGYGSTTWRDRSQLAGAEADECYKLGPLLEGQFPDLAIEIQASRQSDDKRSRKLEVYRRLGVREIWHWDADKRSVAILALQEGRYCERSRTALLPTLDLQQLGGFVVLGENQTSLIRAYWAALRARSG